MMVSLDKILEKALYEKPLSRDEVLHLLRVDGEGDQARLFEVARALRDRYFGNKIYLYGFIYFSTWCRNHCPFCYYRTSNTLCDRYRRTDAQIIDAAARLAESGIHLLDLTMGEDPFYFGQREGFEPLLRLVTEIKTKTGLPLMISWGVVPDEVVKSLPEAGADWLACYQETHNRALFRRLRLHQDYEARLEVKEKAKLSGLLIEEGILSGSGETLEDVADSIEMMKQMKAHQVRVMNFVPQKGTPMGALPPPPLTRENVVLSVLRLVLPHRLIPASLDVYGIAGLRGKLQAGANVVTSLILPFSALRGVAQSLLGIDEGHRTSRAVIPILEELGLREGTHEEYTAWVKKEKKNLPGKAFWNNEAPAAPLLRDGVSWRRRMNPGG
jgi:methylornithine synthase